MVTRLLILCAALTAMLSGGCAVYNNQKTAAEFAQHLVNSGIAVKKTQPLRTEPLRASEALEIKIDDNTIAVYKYNLDIKVQKDRLEYMKHEGRAHIIGIPFPIMVQGSFVVLGLEKHPRKKEIVKAIQTF